jgi:ABC-type multidrug transport system fused ATPase/permease subunit
MNSFVQERVTGMKIVQLFTREIIEADKFKEINDKHKRHGLNHFVQLHLLPIADIISSLTLGFIVWRNEDLKW